MSLNPKQQAFVQEYLIDLNATQAAIRAGYSAKTAHSQGPRLLEHVGVKSAIAEAKKQRSEDTGITAAMVLKELGYSAFADIGDVIEVDDDGRVMVRNLDELPSSVRHSISEISQVTTERKTSDGDVVENVRLSVKLNPKAPMLQMLGKHLNMFAGELNVNVNTWDKVAAIIADAGEGVGDE